MGREGIQGIAPDRRSPHRRTLSDNSPLHPYEPQSTHHPYGRGSIDMVGRRIARLGHLGGNRRRAVLWIENKKRVI